MGILKVTLLGGVRIAHNDWITEAKLTREIQSLLDYFLLKRHGFHSPVVLADMFWGEHSQEKARGSLNAAVWKLKKALEREGIPAEII